MVPFTRLATTIAEQLTLLQQRGLIITDITQAGHYLKHVGYYRLAGYWQIFQIDRIKHTFIPDTMMEQIIELYNFDRELKLLLIDAIERIEVSFRSVLVNEMSTKYTPTWFADPKYVYDRNAMDLSLVTIEKELERSDEEFLSHHSRKYGNVEYPPAWKVFQVLSFGTLSKIYGNIHNNIPEKKNIAKIYDLPSEAWVQSWMQVVSVLRNYCAHHCRVCYRVFSFPPKDMHRRRNLPWIKNIPPSGGHLSQTLYYQLCAVRYLLQTASPDNFFNNKLKQLIAKYPTIELNRMGFIPGWEEEELWQTN